jgi:hypothetical protein
MRRLLARAFALLLAALGWNAAHAQVGSSPALQSSYLAVFKNPGATTYRVVVVAEAFCDSLNPVMPPSGMVHYVNAQTGDTGRIKVVLTPPFGVNIPNTQFTYLAPSVTLPHSYGNYTFYTAVPKRRRGINMAPAAADSNIFVSASFNPATNDEGTPVGISANYGVSTYLVGIPFVYNLGLLNSGLADSFACTMIAPRSGPPLFDTTRPYTPLSAFTSIPFASSTFNLTSNPLATGGSFFMNGTTGQIGFTPTLAATGLNTISYRISQYYQGVLMGSMTTEQNLRVDSFRYASLQSALQPQDVKGGKITNGWIETGTDSLLQFSVQFWIGSPNATSKIVRMFASGIFPVPPGVTETYQGIGTDSAKFIFTAQPGSMSYSGPVQLSVRVWLYQDAPNCLLDTLEQTYNIPLWFGPGLGVDGPGKLVTGSYPNPTTGMVHLSPKAYRWELYTTDGRLVDQKASDRADLTPYQDGLYLLVSFDRMGALLEREKIVKQAR